MDYEQIDIGRAENLINQKFGRWKVLYRTTNNQQGKVRWVCKCDCANHTIKAVDAKSLKSGTSTNCGCQRQETLFNLNDHKTHQRNAEGNIIAKRCFRCGEWLSLDNFWKSSSQKDGYCGECKTCSNKSKENRYNIYKKNAKRRNIDFKLTKEEFYNITQLPCFYCGDFHDYNGIDRIDSTKDYTINNCVSCCEICNKMKLDYSVEFWINHMKKIIQYNGDKNV